MTENKLFGGEGADEYNALFNSLEKCAKDDETSIYNFLDKTPKTTLIVFLVDALHDLGYKIVKS